VTRGYRDGVIEQLADHLAAMTERAEGYRLFALEAAHRLHERHLELERLRAQLAAVRDEYRAHRERVMRDEAGRAA
jgi:hypothetical protein